MASIRRFSNQSRVILRSDAAFILPTPNRACFSHRGMWFVRERSRTYPMAAWHLEPEMISAIALDLADQFPPYAKGFSP